VAAITMLKQIATDFISSPLIIGYFCTSEGAIFVTLRHLVFTLPFF
jgi:hypothetical protein